MSDEITEKDRERYERIKARCVASGKFKMSRAEHLFVINVNRKLDLERLNDSFSKRLDDQNKQ